jgi:hypothetical protein
MLFPPCLQRMVQSLQNLFPVMREQMLKGPHALILPVDPH